MQYRRRHFARFLRKSRSEKGFTLIEILAAIAIMGVLSVASIAAMENVLNDARFDQTVREMEQIRIAFIGETQRLETGLRKNYGFLGDIGNLPVTSDGISPLFTTSYTNASGGASVFASWAVSSAYGIGSGWRGPYLSATGDQDYYKDAWGNNYIYSNPSGGPATLTSYGANGTSGGSGYDADIIISMPNNVVYGTVYGYIAAGSTGLSLDYVPYSSTDAGATLYYPQWGTITSMYTVVSSATGSGKFTFSSVPLGFGSVKIWLPNSAAATSTIGPSIIEINKATAAALPMTIDAGMYSSSHACNSVKYFDIVGGSYSSNTGLREIYFRLSATSGFNWSTFEHFQEKDAAIQQITISSAATAYYRRSGGACNSNICHTSVGTDEISGTIVKTVSPAVSFAAGSTYSFTVRYNSEWSSAHSVHAFRFNCQTLRIHPGI